MNIEQNNRSNELQEFYDQITPSDAEGVIVDANKLQCLTPRPIGRNKVRTIAV
jgi:hypothetical protein